MARHARLLLSSSVVKPNSSPRHFPDTRRSFLAATLVFSVGVGLAVAQPSSEPASRPAPPASNPVPSTNHGFTLPGRDNLGMSDASKKALGWSDRRFVIKAADAGHAEERVAQLAAQRTKNAEVHRLAQKLIEDHKLVNAELRGIASNRDVPIDTEPDHGPPYRRLSRAPDDEFDREFIAHLTDQYEKQVKLFESASRGAKDVEIRTFATKHLPQIREHLQTAQRLQQTFAARPTDAGKLEHAR